MANTTLSRKLGNTMAKNQGKYNPVTERDQKDSGLAFDGLDNTAQRASANKWAHNQHTGVSNEDRGIEERQMPNRKGNIGKTAGPVTAAGKGNPTIEGGRKWIPNAKENFVGNYDKIQDRQLHNNKGNLKG